MNQFISSPNHLSNNVLDQSKKTFNQKLLKEKINELQKVIQSAEKEQNTDIQYRNQTDTFCQEKQTFNTFDKLSEQKDSQIQNLILENQKLVKTIQKLETKVDKAIELQNENQILKKNLQDLKQENEQLKQRKTLKNDIQLSSDSALGFLAAKRNSEIQILTNEVREIKQKNQDLQAKIDQLVSENSDLQSVIRNSDNQFLRFGSQANSIKKYIYDEQLSDKKSTPQKDQLLQLQSELEDAKKIIDQLQSLNNNSKITQQSLNYKFSNSNDKISKSQSIEASDYEKDKKIKLLEDQIKKLEIEKDNQIQNAKLECAQDMKSFQDKLKLEYVLKQQQFQQEDDKPTSEKIRKLNAENNKLQIMLERQNKEIMNMEKKLAEYLIQQEELKKNVLKEQQFQNYLKDEKQMIENQLKEKDKEIYEHKDDIIKLSKERHQLRDQIEQLKYQVQMNQYKSNNLPQSYQSERIKRYR
ncbi:unnamed protein product [Paramecium sonneborni]|uniref:Uncharacterized protein n=1 Tax=Paramecium sonneborni TaxID=65129 RepID=A0A8S1L7G7_9CILI|nr:unnamed protein product [Paramecium sonneborni]